MFVPRQIQKKTATPNSPTSTPKPPPPRPAILPKRAETELCASDVIDPEVAREIVMALEILLSDYSMEYVHGDWLRERMRELEGKDDFIHLSTFVDCEFLAMMKPISSQISFMKALVTCESSVLELSIDKYHVRRKTKPSSFEGTNPDNCTIYIEPHTTNITTNPGKIARMIQDSQIPRKYLPVQFVESRDKSWGFVTLSSAISETDVESRELWPKDWIVMTKFEWRRRDTEYKELRRATRRVPASYHPNLQQNNSWQGVSAQPWPEGSDSRSVSSKSFAARHETSSRDGEITAPDLEPGLIVRLTNLSPSTTKTTINSFVCRSVDRCLRKKKRKGNEENDVASKEIQPVKINYVDYEKGLSQAYIRQSNQGDSELIVSALRKRKRIMRDGQDIKGKKVAKTDRQDWVEGKILVGEEERIYWKKLLSVKNTKRGKGKRGSKNEQEVASDVSLRLKRPREGHEVYSFCTGKRIKFDK